MYLEPSGKSTIEIFCVNGKWLKVVRKIAKEKDLKKDSHIIHTSEYNC